MTSYLRYIFTLSYVSIFDMASGRMNSTIRVINKEKQLLLCYHEIVYRNFCNKLRKFKVPNTALKQCHTTKYPVCPHYFS